MIIEPTGWELKCDRCAVALVADSDVEDEQGMRVRGRAWGWVTVGLWDFCSLECLLRARSLPAVRLNMAAQTRDHMATHADRCCRLHRTHATRGRHHWADCVDPKWAGVSVL